MRSQTLPVFAFIILLCLGAIFRLWLSAAVPQDFVADQKEYHKLALDLIGIKETEYISAYRVPGYPLILALVYKVFGSDNVSARNAVQAGFGCVAAAAVFLLARGIFKSQRPAWTAFVLYLFNPFTAAYTGVALTEATAIVLTALIFLLIFLTATRLRMRYAISLGFLLSFLPQVRPGFLYFSISIYGLLIYRVYKSNFEKTKKWPAILILIMIFSFPFAYNNIRNKMYFNQFSPMTVDNVFVKEFYISLFIDNADTITVIPPEVTNIHAEYSVTKTPGERKKMAAKYRNLSFEEIRRDPEKFLVSRIKKWPASGRSIVYSLTGIRRIKRL